MLDILELQQESQRLAKSGGGEFLDTFVRMPDGNGHVVIRILSPAKKGMFGRDRSPLFSATRVHRVNNKSLHCPKTLQGEKWVGRCPICDIYNYWWKESEKKKTEEEAEILQDKARDIKPVERYYYNVLVRSQKNEQTGQLEVNVGPKILSVGKTVHKMIIRAIVGDEFLDEKPLGDVTDAKTGRDFKLIKTMRQSGRNSFPNYDTSKFQDPSPLSLDPEEIAKWMESLHDLAALRVVKDLEALKHELKIHTGLIAESRDPEAFNPGEFIPGIDDEAAVRANTTIVERNAPVTYAAETAVVEPDTGSKDQATDDDFLKSLHESLKG